MEWKKLHLLGCAHTFFLISRKEAAISKNGKAETFALLVGGH